MSASVLPGQQDLIPTDDDDSLVGDRRRLGGLPPEEIPFFQSGRPLTKTRLADYSDAEKWGEFTDRERMSCLLRLWNLHLMRMRFASLPAWITTTYSQDMPRTRMSVRVAAARTADVVEKAIAIFEAQKHSKA